MVPTSARVPISCDCTPSQGGEDNPKGHALLNFYDVRLGFVGDVHVDTRSRHETMLLRDYDASEQAMTRHKGALWLVDRAFIDAPFWDKKKKRLGITMITRMKSSLCMDSTEGMPVADLSVQRRGSEGSAHHSAQLAANAGA